MRILMPIHDPKTIDHVSEVEGKIEFYAGFEDPNWHNRFGENEDLNRMSAFRNQANMSPRHLEKIARSAMEHGNSLFVTLNAGIYSIEQERWLGNTIHMIRECGATGVILGDPCMAQLAKEYGLKTVASTMIGIYNQDMASWASQIGFDRVILPRDITLSEASCIIKSVPDLEYECFVMRNGCRYSDSHCLCRHSDKYGAICTYLDRAESTVHYDIDRFATKEECYFNHYVFANAFHKDACGMCALWRLIQLGIAAGKVVGRADSSHAVLEDVKVLLHNINIASNCKSEEEYLNKMQFPERSKNICMKGICCYYPEIRFGGE